MPRREHSPDVPLPEDDRPLLPFNLEAEKCVLGAILIDNSQFDVIAPWVDDGFFYRDAHSRIWEAMGVLAEARAAIDLVTLKDELARTGELDVCGGPAYIAALTDGVPHATNVDYYADILKDLKTKRRLVHYARRVINAVRHGEKHSAEILSDADSALLGMSGAHETSRLVTSEQAVNSHFALMDWRVHNKGKLLGIDTGFPQINEQTLGWQRGDLNIVAARPSIGKTALLMNSIVRSARGGARWAVFSLEMKVAQLMDRMLSAESNIPVTRILNGYLTDPDYAHLSAAMSELSALPIYIDDTTRRTVAHMRRTCRRLKMQGGLDGLGIDYIQLMSAAPDQRSENRTRVLDEISRSLKELADELNIAVVALSQLSRKDKNAPDQRPQLTDLRESGGLEQNADTVSFLHRENHKKGGPTEFILDKQRMGPCGTVMLTFDRDITRFDDAPDVPVPEDVPPPPKPRRAPKVPKPPGF